MSSAKEKVDDVASVSVSVNGHDHDPSVCDGVYSLMTSDALNDE